ncbi:MAG: T9SS type A sorting domain-containing protein, partial [Hymenobacter sp.]
PTTTATATFGALSLTSQGDVDGYVTKLTDTGATTDFAWVLPLQGTRADAVNSITATATGLYAAGSFSSPTLQLGPLQLSNPTGQDGFVARLNDAGATASFAWVQGVAGTSSDYLYTVAASGSSVYVAGAFGSPSLAVGTTTLTQTGIYTAFVAKLTDTNTAGTFQWARQLGNGQTASITKLLAQGTNVFAAGSFSSPTLAVGGTTLALAGSYDGFVARLTDGSGGPAFAWALAAGGPGYDIADALALSPTGALYVGGVLYHTATFGSLNATGASSSGTAYLAALQDASLLAATPASAGASLRLYPNPAPGAALLQGAAPGTAVHIFDALGRRVGTTAADASGAAMLPAGLAPGLYVVRAGAGTVRWVVE